MTGRHTILPVHGEGDRKAVEGGRCMEHDLRRITPSVSRGATATSPQTGRIQP